MLVEVGWLADSERAKMQKHHGVTQSTRKAAEIFERQKAEGQLH